MASTSAQIVLSISARKGWFFIRKFSTISTQHGSITGGRQQGRWCQTYAHPYSGYFGPKRFYASFTKTEIDKPDSNSDWHIIPLGESDIGRGCRLSLLSKDMEADRLLNIIGLSECGFRLADHSFLFGPIAIFPKTALSWRVPTPEDITPESLELFFMLQPKLDMLIIGAGERKDVDVVRHQIGSAIAKERIGYEIMETEEAIATFNYMNADHRYVAAALYPPRELKMSHEEAQLGALELKSGDLVDVETRVFSGLFGIYDAIESGQGDWDLRNACYRIWGPRSKKALEAIEKIRESRTENKEKRMERIEQKIQEYKMENYLRAKKQDEQAALDDQKLDALKSGNEQGNTKRKDESERE